MTLSACIPTLNRYDLLTQLISTLRQSEPLPSDIWIIDNGGTYFEGDRIDFTDNYGIQHHYLKFGYNLGCAASWNWFIQNVPEQRVILNDDCKVFSDTLKLLSEADDPNAIVYPAGMPSTNSFSCFLFPDAIREKIGLFDETISPNWAYYEDSDMFRRLTLYGGLELRGVPNCRIDHFGSATVKNLSPQQDKEHHEKFQRATDNYLRKWGGLPHHEKYTEPFGR